MLLTILLIALLSLKKISRKKCFILVSILTALVLGYVVYTYYDEVNIMKNYLINKKIPTKDIFMDHAGISTYDSIYRAKYIFNAKRITAEFRKEILIKSISVCDV